MTPAMPPIRRRTATRLGLRTPYSQPGLIRLVERPMTNEDVSRFINRFEQDMAADRYRVTVLANDVQMTRGYPFPPGHPWPETEMRLK